MAMKSNDRGTELNSVIYSCIASAAAKKTFFYPLYLGHYYCNGDYDVNRNKFDSFLLMYVRSGSGFVSDDGGQHTLSEGDLLLLDCYKPHRYYTKTGWEIYWVHFDGPMAREFYDYAKSKDRLIIPIANRPVLRRFSRLLDVYQKDTNSDEVLLSKLINDLLTELLKPAVKGPDDSQKSAISDEAIRYMSDHFDEKITLEQLAKQANMSPYYFAHVFKNETGMTAHQYLITIRLEYARYLLRTMNMPVQDIADRCGFSNSGAFCTCFKKHTGYAPKEYRNQHL